MYRPFDIRHFGEMDEGVELRRALVTIYNNMLPEVSSEVFIAALPSLVSRFRELAEVQSRQRTQRRLAGQPSNKTQNTEEPSFTLSGRREGNSLRFDSFRYQGAFNQDSVDHFGSDWLRCRAILTTRKVTYSLPTSFMVNELTSLSEILERGALAGAELSFDSREGNLEVRVTRSKSFVNVTTRLRLDWSEIHEYTFECRPEGIKATLAAIAAIQEAFPERKLKLDSKYRRSRCYDPGTGIRTNWNT